MIIIKMNGGLGNQLQQYSLYEKMKQLGKDVKLDISWYDGNNGKAMKRELELSYFPKVSFEACTEEELYRVGHRSVPRKILEKLGIVSRRLYVEHRMYDEALFTLENKVLEGYWACEAYYADILPHLRKKLQFPKSANPANIAMEERIRGCNGVSVHIRRGDYLTEANAKIYGGISTDSYYERAFSYIRERVEKPIFYLFSDDPDYVREKYPGEEYVVVNINHGADSFYDMYLMTCCKHHICANSTFSFWGARLNPYPDKIAVRPLKQRTTCDWYVPAEMKRLWKNWVFIDEYGTLV